jgi:hypothetical protein
MVLRITAHAAEVSALVAAARWVLDGAEGELPPDAHDHLAQVVASYDEAVRALAAPARGDGGAARE